MSDPVYIGEGSGGDGVNRSDEIMVGREYIRQTTVWLFEEGSASGLVGDAEKPAEASVNATDDKEWLVEPRTFWAGLRGVSDLEWITVKQLQAYEAQQADFEKRRREHYERLLSDGPD